MQKVIRDGKVAVIYSPGYGAGFFSWNQAYPQLCFHPKLVELIEHNKKEEITDKLCAQLLGIDLEDSYLYISSRDLKIEWLPEGTQFMIDEYDGYEYIVTSEYLTLTA